MTRLLRTVLAGLAGSVGLGGLAGAAQAATPLTGTWTVQGSRTVFRFQPCGAATCAALESSGRIIRDPDVRDVNNHDPQLRTRRLKGLIALKDLAPAGPGAWKGQVYSPGAGAAYAVDVRQVDADTLTAKGCAAPFLCQTDVLKRLP